LAGEVPNAGHHLYVRQGMERSQRRHHLCVRAGHGKTSNVGHHLCVIQGMERSQMQAPSVCEGRAWRYLKCRHHLYVKDGHKSGTHVVAVAKLHKHWKQ